jgi:hypothetical protein
MATYIIKYHVYNKNGFLLKENGVINCHNRMSEMDAKIKLEMYLIKKYSNFGRLIVISCIEDEFGWIFKNPKSKTDSVVDKMSDLMDSLGDEMDGLFNSIFKKKK